MDLYVFNGPPRAGKDVGKKILYQCINNSITCAFSDPLYGSIMALYSLTPSRLAHIAEHEKDKPQSDLFGKTLRSICISMSEDWLKIFHGDRKIFSKLLANRVNQYGLEYDSTVIIDSGFHDELEGFVENIEFENIHVINLYREGKSFEMDSRHYITADNFRFKNTTFTEVTNPGTEDEYRKILIEMIRKHKLEKNKNG